MNLERLPEIVRALQIKRNGLTLHATSIGYVWAESGADYGLFEADAANACVVAMLGRLVANGMWVVIMRGCVRINSLDLRDLDGVVFSGDLLNALYDAFRTHPDWFKETP